MLETVLDIGGNRSLLSHVCWKGWWIWLPQPSPCLVELTWTARIGKNKPVTGVLVVTEGGSKPEWGGNGGEEKVTELVNTPVLKWGLSLLPVFGTWSQSSF